MDSVNRGRNDVEQLLRNAELRTELEPFLDESVLVVDTQQMPTSLENEFLASLLAWESAPVLPIAQWFDPPLVLKPANQMNDQQLHEELHEVIGKLFDKHIVLECTDHLNDRQLYQLIACEILSSKEKKVDFPGNTLTWHCVDQEHDEELWLRYYARPEDRDLWLEFNPNGELPPMELPPHPRVLPNSGIN